MRRSASETTARLIRCGTGSPSLGADRAAADEEVESDVRAPALEAGSTGAGVIRASAGIARFLTSSTEQPDCRIARRQEQSPDHLSPRRWSSSRAALMRVRSELSALGAKRPARWRDPNRRNPAAHGGSRASAFTIWVLTDWTTPMATMRSPDRVLLAPARRDRFRPAASAPVSGPPLARHGRSAQEFSSSSAKRCRWDSHPACVGSLADHEPRSPFQIDRQHSQAD
jgi:hypothetical protein